MSKNRGITSSIVHLANGPKTLSRNHIINFPHVSIIGFIDSFNLLNDSRRGPKSIDFIQSTNFEASPDSSVFTLVVTSVNALLRSPAPPPAPPPEPPEPLPPPEPPLPLPEPEPLLESESLGNDNTFIWSNPANARLISLAAFLVSSAAFLAPLPAFFAAFPASLSASPAPPAELPTSSRPLDSPLNAPLVPPPPEKLTVIPNKPSIADITFAI